MRLLKPQFLSQSCWGLCGPVMKLKFLFQLSPTLYGKRKCLLWSQVTSLLSRCFVLVTEQCFLCHLCKWGLYLSRGSTLRTWLALVMCSEHGNGALMAFDNIPYLWFGFSQCWFWPFPFCVESDALTVSEIIGYIVPGHTPLALGVDLEVPVHSWALGWMIRFFCPRPVHTPFSGLGQCKKLGGICSTASTCRW